MSLSSRSEMFRRSRFRCVNLKEILGELQNRFFLACSAGSGPKEERSVASILDLYFRQMKLF